MLGAWLFGLFSASLPNNTEYTGVLFGRYCTAIRHNKNLCACKQRPLFCASKSCLLGDIYSM